MLGEYEGALLKARELWDYIKPLYVKLHKYVALKLKGPEAVGKPLPVHLLSKLINFIKIRFIVIELYIGDWSVRFRVD